MFGRKKEGKKPAGGRPRAANQFGLLDMGGMTDFDPTAAGGLYGDEDDEAGLEAELHAITSGKALPPKAKKRPPVADPNALHAMVAESMRDIPSDEDDGSDLEDDPELLAELQQLTPDVSPESSPISSPSRILSPVRRPAPPPPTATKTVTSVIEERITMYQTALLNAKASGESGFKLRRLERGLKTLDGLMKTAKAGKPINEEDMPPEVATGAAKPKPESVTAAPPIPSVSGQETPIESTATTSIPKSPPKSPAPCPKSSPKGALKTPSPEEEFKPQSPVKTSSPVEERPVPSAPMESPEKKVAMSPPISAGTSTAADADTGSVYDMLCKRKKQYQQAALVAKRAGDTEKALDLVKTAKKFDVVIAAVQQGQPVDLSGMPPPPPGFGEQSPQNVLSPKKPMPSPRKVTTQPQGSATTESPPLISVDDNGSDEPVDPSVFNAPPPPSSILEALEQRRDKYQSTMKESQEQNNAGRARRMGRLVKQYEDAIKLYKAGKPVPYDDLPDPPGFAPIPRPGAPTQPPPPKPPTRTVQSAGPSPQEASQAVEPARAKVGTVIPGPSAAPISPARPTAGGTVQVPAAVPAAAPTGQQKQGTPRRALHEKQMMMLQERERLFREAALEAKKRGNIELAKDYLRKSKGFNPMIENLKCGLPVNMESAPIPPQQLAAKKKKVVEPDPDGGFEVIDYSDCIPQGDREEMYSKLEEDLKSQINMCVRNRDHFSHLGDVNNSRKFQLLAEHAKKDVTCLSYALKNGDPVPRFHYEMRTFTIIQCFTDLNDNELELVIVRGLNYACSNPKEIDTFVRFEFPYPAENSPKDRTSTVKDTNNPEYNKSFVLPINRKARTFARVVKSKAVKLEVVSKGGLFRSDTVLGTVTIKLAPLETKNIIHDSFDVMEGRRTTGGKLEVKVRIREPLGTRQVEEIKEKWLVIDQYRIK